jgi:hypothetical protein
MKYKLAMSPASVLEGKGIFGSLTFLPEGNVLITNIVVSQ